MASQVALGMNQAWKGLALIDVMAGVGVGMRLKGFQNNIVFNPDTVVLADLTESTFHTYAFTTLTWDVPSISDSGSYEVHSNRVTERPTDAVVPQDMFGYFLTSAAGVLYGGGTFDVGGLPMDSALDSAMLTVVFRLDGTGYVSLIS